MLHPWWGLNEDVIAFADRLAGEGFAIAAPDLFDGSVASTVEDAERLARSADEAAVESLVLATIDWLAERLGPDAKIGLLGFSFGAWWSVASAADRDRVAASVVYYGAVSGPELAGSTAPVLGHFAETDQFESDEAICEMESDLRSAGREATIHRYPGTRALVRRAVARCLSSGRRRPGLRAHGGVPPGAPRARGGTGATPASRVGQ